MKIDQVSDSVHVVAGTNVNWALIDDGSGVTVIDAGYPADTADVLDSIHQIGRRPADVRAVLITHAHLDHIGAIPTLIEQAGMPVYTGAEEVRHAKREYLQQITPTGMLKQLANRRGRRWVAHTLRAVRGHTGMAVPRAETGEPATLAALPGGLLAIPTPATPAATPPTSCPPKACSSPETPSSPVIHCCLTPDPNSSPRCSTTTRSSPTTPPYISRRCRLTPSFQDTGSPSTSTGPTSPRPCRRDHQPIDADNRCAQHPHTHIETASRRSFG